MKTSKPGRRSADRQSISAQIRETVSQRRISGTRLALDSGLDRRAVARWLRGEQDILLGSADRIAHALGLRLTESTGRNKAPRPPAREVGRESTAVPTNDSAPVDRTADDETF